MVAAFTSGCAATSPNGGFAGNIVILAKFRQWHGRCCTVTRRRRAGLGDRTGSPPIAMGGLLVTRLNSPSRISPASETLRASFPPGDAASDETTGTQSRAERDAGLPPAVAVRRHPALVGGV